MGVIQRFWQVITSGFKLMNGSTQLLHVTKSGDDITLAGGDTSTEDLYISPNSVDTYPQIRLFGNETARFIAKAGQTLEFYEEGIGILRLYDDGTDAVINGLDTNNDMYIKPNGTGVLKFGTHSALAGESVTGYITIKDEDGNSRKIAVVS